MLNRYDQLWYAMQKRGALRPAIGMSALLHIVLAGVVLYVSMHREIPVTPTEVYALELSPEKIPEPEPTPEPPAPEPEIVPQPEPKPEPPPPEPEPEPEPEPPKPEPKPELKPEPKPDPPKPKPEPPKEQPKPQPKPEPKPEPKPDPPKPKPVKQTPPKPETPAPPAQPEVRMKQVLPGPLSAWGRLVQKKVEKGWRIPGGVLIDPNENEAVVSFWVGKSGALIGTPEIVKHAADRAVGRSAVEAIKQSAPFPPLPDNYGETEAHVIYTFVPAG